MRKDLVLPKETLLAVSKSGKYTITNRRIIVKEALGDEEVISLEQIGSVRLFFSSIRSLLLASVVFAVIGLYFLVYDQFFVSLIALSLSFAAYMLYKRSGRELLDVSINSKKRIRMAVSDFTSRPHVLLGQLQNACFICQHRKLRAENSAKARFKEINVKISA